MRPRARKGVLMSRKAGIKVLTKEEIVYQVKDSLVVILGNATTCLKTEGWFSTSGREKLEGIKKQVWVIDKLIGKFL